MRDIIVYSDREMILWHRATQFLKDTLDHGRRKLFRGEAIAPADNFDARCLLALGKGSQYIEVERLASAAWLFGAIQHRQGPYRWRQRAQEVGHRERTEQPHRQHADPLALFDQV